jgi:hypothetical protein
MPYKEAGRIAIASAEGEPGQKAPIPFAQALPYGVAIVLYSVGILVAATATHELGVIGGVMIFLLGSACNLISIVIYSVNGLRTGVWRLLWGCALLAPVVLTIMTALIFVK